MKIMAKGTGMKHSNMMITASPGQKGPRPTRVSKGGGNASNSAKEVNITDMIKFHMIAQENGVESKSEKNRW